MSEPTTKRSIRWLPAKIMLGLVPLGLIFIWFFSGGTQSVKILATEMLAAATLGLLLLWFLFFSRLGLKLRLIGFGVFAGLALLLVNLVEIREVSGDVMPILAWKWSAKPDQTLANGAKTAKGNSTLRTSSEHDFPRFLGRQSSASVDHINLARDWQVAPPKEQWRIPMGAAWSGFAIAGDYAITQEQRGDSEMVTCYALASGELLWAHGDKQRFDTTVGGIGPRATPTIWGNRVFTFGALGLLNCLDLTTGRLIWQKHTAQEHEAEKPRWGYSGSPLVIPASDNQPELVVVSPGGAKGRSLVAYASEDGSLAWAGGSAPPGYASPQRATLAGSEMILIFNHGSVAGHDPVNGQVLWQVPWPGDNACVANPRVLNDDQVLVSAGYGRGTKLYRISQQDQTYQTELLYESRRMKAKFANFVLHQGYVYGLDDGILACMDAQTGERAWKKGRYGHGQLLLAGNLLLLQAEDGELHLIEAQPQKHHRLGGIQILDGKSWNTMALVGSLLLMRNHMEAVCLELALE